MSPVPVSIIIPIKNEVANLPRCLAPVRWAAEIWVVDSYSNDGSQSIAEAAGAKLVQFKFNGTWPKKKNWALQNLTFSQAWVFILDADEELPPDAEAEIRAVIADAARSDLNTLGHINSTFGSPAGYWVNRRFMFMEKWLKHAYY